MPSNVYDMKILLAIAVAVPLIFSSTSLLIPIIKNLATIFSLSLDSSLAPQEKQETKSRKFRTLCNRSNLKFLNRQVARTIVRSNLPRHEARAEQEGDSFDKFAGALVDKKKVVHFRH